MRTDRLLFFATIALAGTTALAQTAPPAQDGYAVPDAQLQKDVSQALHNDPKLSNFAIVATASQGTITLKGNVATEEMRGEAERAVAGVSGVRSIQDNLDVTAPAASASNDAPPPPDEPEPGQTGREAVNQPAPSNPYPVSAGALPPPPPADTAQTGSYTPYPGTSPRTDAGRPDWGPRGNAHVPSGYNAEPQAAPPQPVSGPVTLPAGTLLNVRTAEPLSTGGLKGGEFFAATAAADVYAGGVLAIPRGASLTGRVLEAKNAGALGGSPRLELTLTGMQLGQDSYELVSDTWSSQGPSKSGYTAANTVGGAAVGAVIGAVAGGGLGAGIGAVAGGASGAVISGATHGPRLDLPPEALLHFHLAAPLTVQPVCFAEAARLAASSPTPPQPVLRARPVYLAAPYPYGYYARSYPYPVRVYPYGYSRYYGRY